MSLPRSRGKVRPVHRKDGAQDVEVFLDPHHVALEIFPVIAPRHVEVMIEAGRWGKGLCLRAVFFIPRSHALGDKG